MSKSKENQELTNPLENFKLLKGEFTPEPLENEPKEDDEEIDDAEEDDEVKRFKEADKKLLENSKKVSKKQDVSENNELEGEDEEEYSDPTIPSIYKEFAKNLYEKNIVDFDDSDEDFEDSEEGLEKLIYKTTQNRINNWVSSLPDDFKKLIEFTENGGKAKDFINVYYNQNSWEDFKIDNESNQEKAVIESLKLSGESDEDIQDMVTEWKDNGSLEKRAKSALTKLQKFESVQKENLVVEAKIQAEAKRKEQEKTWNDFKENLMSKESIKGFKITPKIKDKLWDFMTVVDKTGKTQYQKALEKDNEASLLFALQAMNNFDIKKLEEQVANKVNSKFSDILRNTQKNSKDKISKGSTQEQDENNPFAGFKNLK